MPNLKKIIEDTKLSPERYYILLERKNVQGYIVLCHRATKDKVIMKTIGRYRYCFAGIQASKTKL
jgi:hypothetical protein